MPPKRSRAGKAAAKGSTASANPKASTSSEAPEDPMACKDGTTYEEDDGVAAADDGFTLNLDLEPISDVLAMFVDMVKRLSGGKDADNKKMIDGLEEDPVKIRVGTLCSGTDAPIFALRLLQKAVALHGKGPRINFEHVFSCEIESFKQGFLRRNMVADAKIFRNVVELARDDESKKTENSAGEKQAQATTAGGFMAPVPGRGEVDMVVGGCSCVDYSTLNKSPPKGSAGGLMRYARKHYNAGKRCSVKVDPDLIEAVDEFLKDPEKSGKVGESALTFFSTLKYVATARPLVAILENVAGAPWGMYENIWFPRIGYVAACQRVDTKKFYLPQTRVRGYMVAVDAQELGLEATEQLVKHWNNIMKACERDVSSPITAYLRSPEDIFTVHARADLEAPGSKRSNVDWSFSRLRHVNLREEHQLDEHEAFFSSKYVHAGSVVAADFPSHGWRHYWAFQPVRVVDYMDLAYSLGRKGRGVDLAHKTYVLDVSQNVDRMPLTSDSAIKKMGLTGCLTPSGQPIITDLARPVSGTETLALQGLPVSEMTLTTLTDSELRDMAGNAMSVPVIGAAMLSILMAIQAAAPKSLPRGGTAEARSTTFTPEGDRQGLALVRSLPDLGHLLFSRGLVARQCRLVQLGRRLCFCIYAMAPSGLQDEFKICSDCSATACSKCRGNPRHKFEDAVEINRNQEKLLSYAQVRVATEQAMPQQIRIDVAEDVIGDALGSLSAAYRDAVMGLLCSSASYFYQETKVTEIITVVYQSKQGIARWEFSCEKARLYLLVSPAHAERKSLRQLYDLDDQPAIKVEFNQKEGAGNSDDIRTFDMKWFLWIPLQQKFSVTMQRTAEGEVLVSQVSPCFSGTKDLARTVLEQIQSLVVGKYKHHPLCGTPFDRLHSKQRQDDKLEKEEKIYFMQISHRMGSPDKDVMAFVLDPRPMEPHEHREVLLALDKGFDLGSLTGQPQNVSAFVNGVCKRCDHMTSECLSLAEPPKTVIAPSGTMAGTTCTWHKHDRDLEKQVWASLTAVLPASWMGDMPQWRACLSRLQQAATQPDQGCFFVLPAYERTGFIRALRSFLLRIAAPPPQRDGQITFDEWFPVDKCAACVIPPPTMPYAGAALCELPEHTERFERDLMNLPQALAIAARIRKAGPDSTAEPHSAIDSPADTLAFSSTNAVSLSGQDLLDIKILVNPAQVASSALAHLEKAGRSADSGVISLSARMETGYTPSRKPRLEPFSDQIKTTNSQDGLIPAERFPHSIRAGTEVELTPMRFSLNCRRLRKDQAEAVQWMMWREAAAEKFQEVEYEEENHPDLNLRISAKAVLEPRERVRGGIVAHAIGFGKTVVMLALVANSERVDKAEDAAARARAAHNPLWRAGLPKPLDVSNLDLGGLKATNNLNGCEGFIALKATLIIVPDHIINQWENEAHDFLHLKNEQFDPKTMDAFHVLKFQTLKQLYKTKLDELKRANIIFISSKVFTTADFRNELRNLSGGDKSAADPSQLKGRALRYFYGRAKQNSELVVRFYHDMTANLGRTKDAAIKAINEHLIPAMILRDEKDDEKNLASRAEPSSRKKASRANGVDGGGEGADDSEPPRKKQKTAKAAASTTLQWAPQLLVNFRFRRVIWDEFSYENEWLSLFFEHVSAFSKFLLSGTPRVSTLADIANTARLMDVHLVRPERRMPRGLPPVTVGPVLSPMAECETFREYSSAVRSVDLAVERHQVAESFVAQYFRANPPNARQARIDVTVEEVRVQLSLEQLTQYALVENETKDKEESFDSLDATYKAPLLDGSYNDLLNRLDDSALCHLLKTVFAFNKGHVWTTFQEFRINMKRRLAKINERFKFLMDKLNWLLGWLECQAEGHFLAKGDPRARKVSNDKDYADTVAKIEGYFDLIAEAWAQQKPEAVDLTSLAHLQDRVVALHGKSHLKGNRADPTWDLDGDWKRPEKYGANKATWSWAEFFDVEGADSPEGIDKLMGTGSDEFALHCKAKLATDLVIARFCVRPDWDPAEAVVKSVRPEDRIAPWDKGQTIQHHVQLVRSLPDQLGGYISGWFGCDEPDPSLEAFKAQVQGWDKKACIDRCREDGLEAKPSDTATKLREKLARHKAGGAPDDAYHPGRAATQTRSPFPRVVDDHKAKTMTAMLKPTLDEIKATRAQLDFLKLETEHMQRELRLVETAAALKAWFAREDRKSADAMDEEDGDDNDDDDTVLPACAACGRPVEPQSEWGLLTVCGHVVCEPCRGTRLTGPCPDRTCWSWVAGRPMLGRADMGRGRGPRGSPVPTKTDAIVAALRRVQGAGEHALLFAQYGPVLDGLEAALGAAGVSCVRLGAANPAEALEAFKDGGAGTVLLLDIEAESSAGSNLTVANHVLFAAPYWHPDRHTQVTTVRQAAGRAVRSGQKRPVRVTHFVAAGTVEEEVLGALRE